MRSTLTDWAIRHGVRMEGLLELRELMGTDPVAIPAIAGESEAAVQSRVRLEAARKGLKLWRNNVGALLDSRGVPVRYGLANDSPQLNKVIKSGDLIGWRPILIGPQHIGQTIAQFVSRECKATDWRFTGNEHERAQMKWISAILADGGDAKFCTGEGTL